MYIIQQLGLCDQYHEICNYYTFIPKLYMFRRPLLLLMFQIFKFINYNFLPSYVIVQSKEKKIKNDYLINLYLSYVTIIVQSGFYLIVCFLL